MSLPSSTSQYDTPIENEEQLVTYLEGGCKPLDAFSVVTEHERHSFRADDHRPLTYEAERGSRSVLELLQNQFGYAPILERDVPIALSRQRANITLEPGGQIELAGAPLATVHECKSEML